MIGCEFGYLSDDTIVLFREKMAIDIFCNDWDPQTHIPFREKKLGAC